MNSFDLHQFLADLERAKIHYALARHRDETVMVQIAVPGERWEVEVFSDGSVEVERFVSGGEIGDQAALKELFVKFSDASAARASRTRAAKASGSVKPRKQRDSKKGVNV